MNDDFELHETAFIRSFVVPEKQERYLELRIRKRRKWLDRLNHYLQFELVTATVATEQKSKSILNDNEVSMCWMIADSSSLDQQSLDAREGIREVSSADFGVIVSFVPGELALLKPEAPAESIWLCKE